MSRNVQLWKEIADRQVPSIARGDRVPLIYTGTPPAETEIAAAAAGAYTTAQGGVIDLDGAREITIGLQYDPASATGRPAIILLGSIHFDQPGATDDAWLVPQGSDGVITDTTLGGALPVGQDFTATPQWGAQTLKRALWLPKAVAAATDELRDGQVFKVSGFRWLQVLYAEHGDTAAPGSFLAHYMLSA